MNNIYWLLLKKEIIDNRKALLLGLVGILASYILTGLFLGNTRRANCGVELFLFIFMGGLIVSIGASLTFSNMNTKEDRISTLMLPATAFQKYLIRWIATVPSLLIILIVSFVLGDCAKMLMATLNGYSARSIWVYFSDPTEHRSLEVCILFSSIICSQALYFFGSILWPKLSFIKTLAVLQILQLVFALIFFCIPWNVNFDFDLDETGVLWCAYTFDLVFCSVFYWLAYVRFRQSQVIYKLF